MANLAWADWSWGFVLLAAFAGWGRLVNCVLLPETQAYWGIDAAAGLALTVFLGGLVNLAGFFSAALLVVYAIAGAVLCIGRLYNIRTTALAWLRRAAARLRGDWWLSLLTVLLLAIVGVRYAAAPTKLSFTSNPTYAGVSFNPHDDMHSYLVMPEKILQTGRLAPDPFNARQMESSLGGAHVLTALVRAVRPLESLHLLEEGVGLLIYTGVLAALLARLQLPPRVGMFLLLVGQCSLEPNLNISSFVTGAALFGAMLFVLLEPDTARAFSPRWSVALGFFVAGACALKSTFVPITGILVGTAWLIRWPKHSARRVGLALAASLLTIVLTLLPWMLVKYREYGTPLYPLLGLGHHWRAHLPVPDDATRTAAELFWQENRRDLVAPAVAAILLALLACWPAVRQARRESWAAGAGIVAAWLGGMVALGFTMGGYGVARYVFAAPLIGVPVLLALTWPQPDATNPSRRRVAFATAGWLLVAVAWLWNGRFFTVEYLRLSLREDFTHPRPRYPLTIAPLREQARRMQQSVPAGEPLLVRLTHPFLLDFRRNPVFVADWPGAVSPPPGLPAFQGAEAMAGYLLDQNVRYVAYAHAREANYSHARFQAAGGPDQPKFERQLARLTLDFQANLAELGTTRQRIYDDGAVFVIDLRKVIARPHPPRPRVP